MNSELTVTKARKELYDSTDLNELQIITKHDEATAIHINFAELTVDDKREIQRIFAFNPVGAVQKAISKIK